MYVIMLTYKAPLEEVDKHVPAHRDYLAAQYADGTFLASGRQVPRTGGVFLARQMDRERLDAIIARDPFNINDVADYTVVEFTPSQTAPELESLIEPIRS